MFLCCFENFEKKDLKAIDSIIDALVSQWEAQERQL
jgi:hypothetical protein